MKRRLESIGVRLVLATGAVLAALLFLALAAAPAQAQSRVAIPEASALYRHRVEQAVADVWGVNASPARLAAQLHQESGWRPKATSSVGAQGVAQFMPATAKWIAELFPDKLGQFDPWDAQQAILAAAIYDKWLLDRVQPLGWTRMSECTRWNFALQRKNTTEQAAAIDAAIGRLNAISQGREDDREAIRKFAEQLSVSLEKVGAANPALRDLDLGADFLRHWNEANAGPGAAAPAAGAAGEPGAAVPAAPTRDQRQPAGDPGAARQGGSALSRLPQRERTPDRDSARMASNGVELVLQGRSGRREQAGRLHE